jgi:hypothetical protein
MQCKITDLRREDGTSETDILAMTNMWTDIIAMTNMLNEFFANIADDLSDINSTSSELDTGMASCLLIICLLLLKEGLKYDRNLSFIVFYSDFL